MDVNEHERLSNITLRHTLKLRNNAVIVVLHFTVTVKSSTTTITHGVHYLKMIIVRPSITETRSTN